MCTVCWLVQTEEPPVIMTTGKHIISDAQAHPHACTPDRNIGHSALPNDRILIVPIARAAQHRPPRASTPGATSICTVRPPQSARKVNGFKRLHR